MPSDRRASMRATSPKKRAAREPQALEGRADTSPTASTVPEPVLIVGIGASAGGLEATSALIHALSPDIGLAYVVVQHLDPAHESMLAELLGRVAPIPVAQATDGVRVVPNSAYVIPPDTSMVLTGDRLELAPRVKSRRPPLPVDAFFRSLADVHGSNAIGVVLSGVGSDGASGLEAIKSAGGITFAQDPVTARFDGMPAAAIATGCVDFVLSPADIARRLEDIGRHPLTRHPAEDAPPGDSAPLATVFQLLHRRSGIDFSQYKDGTVRRRMLRRMVLRGVDVLRDYIALLREETAEVDALGADLLIGVTRFFRDREAFAALSDTALPDMMRDRAAGAPIRVWVPGCATGEEAFSVAICLLEFLDGRTDVPPIQVFATDVSESAIAVARKGLYPAGIAKDMSPERLRRFFVKVDQGYRIAQAVRDRCVFARQNVTSDPPFSQLDLVSCRNVLIYLQPVVHARVLAIFHYALKPGGLLVLGTSESVQSAPSLFTPIDAKHRVYARASVASGRHPHLDFGLSAARAASAVSGFARVPTTHGPLDVLGAADEVVLNAYSPTGIVLDAAFQVLQFRGHTKAYLDPPNGLATLDALRMVRVELRAALRSALRRARDDAATVYVEGLRVQDPGKKHRRVNLRVIPFHANTVGALHFVVLFEEADSAVGPRAARGAKHSQPRPARTPAVPRTMAQLRQELDSTRRELHAAIEELQSFVEELQAANEEAQSANEELQSSNEELETAKEELESGYEELTTLNDELRARIGELGRLNDDLANVLTAIHVPLIIVGPDLRIRRFTAGAERLMRLVPADVGRHIGDITSYTEILDVSQVVTGVLRTLSADEREVQDDQGRWHSVTVRPYVTAAGAIEGAVLVYQDIDLRRRHEQELDAARGVAELANKTKSAFLANMSHELRTPLNAISGYASLMAQGIHGPVTVEQGRDLGRILASGRHLLGLINDILNYAQLRSVQVHFASELVPLAETLAAAAMTEPQAQAKGVGFTYVPGDPKLAVRGDRQKVLQIVVNLLANATKFTPASGQITLACDPAGDEIRVWVHDTGRGIAPQELERVFEPFVQVGHSLGSGETGVGLGLSISREFARAMGGDLTVESVVGQGSTFTLELPRWISRAR